MENVSPKIRVFDRDNNLVCFVRQDVATRLLASGAQMHGRGRRGYIRVGYSRAVEVEQVLLDESRHAGKSVRGQVTQMTYEPPRDPLIQHPPCVRDGGTWLPKPPAGAVTCGKLHLERNKPQMSADQAYQIRLDLNRLPKIPRPRPWHGPSSAELNRWADDGGAL